MFKNRKEAGLELAKELEKVSLNKKNSIVIGLPRGGVPVAYQVAKQMDLPLDIFCVKKIGYPSNPELALGAIGEDGEVFFNQDLLGSSGLSEVAIESLKNAVHKKAQDQAARLREGRPAPDVRGKTVILVDDGIATGATAEAAIKLLKQKGAKEIILAAPVAPTSVEKKFSKNVDQLIILETSDYFYAVGQWYETFFQVDDEEVIRLLKNPKKTAPEKQASNDITVDLDGVELPGRILLAPQQKGWIIFAHGSGSSHLSRRNNWVAEQLNKAGLCTFLFDLLTFEEDIITENRFNINLLAERLISATKWLMNSSYYERGTQIGYFGASTGAAAAFAAAAEIQDSVPLYTIVSRGGRPDLAGEKNLNDVRVPSLLIVGSQDLTVIELNKKALENLPQGRMELIYGATHLFEEPGTLEEVAKMTSMWFTDHLYPRRVVSPTASPPGEHINPFWS